MYPIQKLLYAEFKKTAMTKKELAYNMNYKNLSKGIERIGQFFRGDYYGRQFADRLALTLDVDKKSMAKAYEETETEIKGKENLLEILERELEEENFKPYIYIDTEHSRPKSISMAAMCGGTMKYIRVDESVTALPDEEQTEKVAQIIRDHYTKSEGKCPLFGNITGYRYFKEFYKTIIFDTDGEEIEIVEEHEFGLPRP